MKLSSDTTIREAFGCGAAVPPTHNFLVGVELEVESVRNSGGIPSGWSVVPDGSLRNEGVEFISPPLPRETLVTHFKMVHGAIKHYTEYPAFSERTSIHVHINCLDLTEDQTKSIILWYALMEPIFFAAADSSRRNNIHCVGLDQTMLAEHYKRSLHFIVQRWSKYTALNLVPLKSQGTLEFRHMHGHNDPEKFAEWLLMIEKLWTFGKNNLLKKSGLTEADVLFAFDFIFGETSLAGLRGSLFGIVEDSLIDVKLSLI